MQMRTRERVYKVQRDVLRDRADRARVVFLREVDVAGAHELPGCLRQVFCDLEERLDNEVLRVYERRRRVPNSLMMQPASR